MQITDEMKKTFRLILVGCSLGIVVFFVWNVQQIQLENYKQNLNSLDKQIKTAALNTKDKLD